MKKTGVILLIGVGWMIAAFTHETPLPGSTAALGRKLFFDPILSRTYTISCASCHQPAHAFADTSAVSTGIFNRKGKRNTPSAMNTRLQVSFFWDGRASTLEEQALIPIANPDEMGLPVDEAVARLQKNKYYRTAFKQLFHENPSRENLAKALAGFERTLETNDTPFDDWRLHENEAAVSAAAKRGFALFNGKAECIKCHFGPDFNNVEFRSIGLFDGKQLNDSGRAAITHRATDLGKFKIGSLRNIAQTAPYMHNGMFKTLAEVIDYYNDPDKVVPHSINRDTLLQKPLSLTNREKQDLEAFLRTLSGKEM
ncbi:cytochrome c peroxidase [Chitinophaga costaii]|uniref:Cytochrome c peroxidase n=1 Tax=Chitinophaga costaii TaxID=1335309 RepID=A0A1C4G5X8_9BACT|nr:cytochrome c peroxidase [Chitinophaga costaii]PUZ19693.1 cytochrome-c peroxidase [Chitinophaga costaii]SCC63343.1 cytochrome c peroxidase [Chitinophaga costaii]